MNNQVDLRQTVGLNGGLELCFYCGNGKARITSSTFPVWIPSLMGDIPMEPGKVAEDTPFDKSCLLNEDNYLGDSVPVAYSIIAENFTPYGHRLDGWIPEFKIQTLTAETGTIAKQDAGSTKGESDPVPMHPSHPITKPLTLNSNNLNNIVFNNLVATTSTEVDFQELNNKYIEYGQPMIGAFINGGQSRFVVIAIQNAVPRLDQSERGPNKDNPDTSIDGDTNPPNGSGRIARLMTRVTNTIKRLVGGDTSGKV